MTIKPLLGSPITLFPGDKITGLVFRGTVTIYGPWPEYSDVINGRLYKGTITQA